MSISRRSRSSSPRRWSRGAIGWRWTRPAGRPRSSRPARATTPAGSTTSTSAAASRRPTRARTSASCPTSSNPIFSELNPPTQFDETHRYYSPRGYWRGLSGRWEPFVTASISFELPLGNNAAKGRLAQAQATLRSSEIQFRDRTRLIGDNITGVVQTLRAAAEGVQRAREAVERTTATYEGALAQLRAGELTLIDTLTTEEELLGDQTELLRQQQVYLSTLARLRFEAGQLVTFSGLGDIVRVAPVPADRIRRTLTRASRGRGRATGRVVVGVGVRSRRFRVVHPSRSSETAAMSENPLFRKAALDKLASPERLDVLMQVTSPMGWLALTTVGGILIGVIVWSILGSIPERIDGQGVLLRGGANKEVRSTGSGTLASLDLKEGQMITRRAGARHDLGRRQQRGSERRPDQGAAARTAAPDAPNVDAGAERRRRRRRRSPGCAATST